MKGLKQSELEYDALHAAEGFEEEKEYYKALGMLLKGKKSVDIGCGYGFIEQFSPETVGVDFSEEALKEARKRGVKKLVKASAENLPFKNNEFEVALSLGVLEHVADIEKAISEMVRVSELQINVVHAALPYGLEIIRKPLQSILKLEEQPIEKPQKIGGLKNLFKKYGARTIVEGVWNYIDLRWINKNIPYGIVKFPSHHFLITLKTPNLERKFLKEFYEN